MEDAEAILRFWEWRDSGQSRAPCNMIHWDHIDGIVDIRYQTKLDAPFNQPPDEVVSVGNYNTPPSSSIRKRSGLRESGEIASPADLASPTTYPGRTMWPLNPLFPASNSSFSDTDLLWP